MTIEYSLELIRGLGSDLHTVADVMDGRNAAARYEQADVGRQVADALDHFADNRDDKRELLTKSRRNVGDMAQATAASFEEFDQEMAKAVKTILEEPA
ncbi:MAG: hypothetical protein JWN08_3594 [Frankiales bacterium]|jgi:hypothetical protein|nr:hypothetical protein [Frankiales bacterium]MCW2814844.1 hypothetical protein [Nocardioides sp.]